MRRDSAFWTVGNLLGGGMTVGDRSAHLLEKAQISSSLYPSDKRTGYELLRVSLFPFGSQLSIGLRRLLLTLVVVLIIHKKIKTLYLKGHPYNSFSLIMS